MAIWGPHTYPVAVCQPCVPTLAAVAVMAAERLPHQLACRINPTADNNLAIGKPIEWFEKKLVATAGTLPAGHIGARHRICLGFLQLTAFMSMNPARHDKAFADLYEHPALHADPPCGSAWTMTEWSAAGAGSSRTARGCAR